MRARTGNKTADRIALVIASPFVSVMAIWYAVKGMWDALKFSLACDVHFFKRQWREAGSIDFNRRRDPDELDAMLEEIEARMYDARNPR